ncbi:MAG: hypothetical protein PHG48_07745 [Eubacteriales bacterium]|nr:hypothetical protein [Eubacteriales bacterium]
MIFTVLWILIFDTGYLELKFNTDYAKGEWGKSTMRRGNIYQMGNIIAITVAGKKMMM